jgi:hypothetical protein
MTYNDRIDMGDRSVEPMRSGRRVGFVNSDGVLITANESMVTVMVVVVTLLLVWWWW